MDKITNWKKASKKEFAKLTQTEYQSEEYWINMYVPPRFGPINRMNYIFNEEFNIAIRSKISNPLVYQTYVIYYSDKCRENLPYDSKIFEIRNQNNQVERRIYVHPRFAKKYKEFYDKPSSQLRIFKDYIIGERNAQNWVDEMVFFIKNEGCNSKATIQMGENLLRPVNGQMSLQEKKAKKLGITRDY